MITSQLSATDFDVRCGHRSDLSQSWPARTTVDWVNQDPREWERAMMARIRVGDDAALAAVYDQYSPMVHGIAEQLVRTDAAEVCQDVFMDLWLRPDRFDLDRGALRTFIAVMTRRRCIDQMRSVGRRRARERRASDLNPVAPPNVDEAAMAMLTAERVRQALESLPTPQREAIEYAYLEGMTFRQVALATGTAEGTAKSRLRLGLSRLAKDLGTLRSDTERAELA